MMVRILDRKVQRSVAAHFTGAVPPLGVSVVFPGYMADPSCSLALYGYPTLDARGQRVEPCPGYIESDYAPGTFYPCASCNDAWWRGRPEIIHLPHGETNG